MGKSSENPERRRLRRLIRAFKRTFPHAPPGLGKTILRSSLARGGAARRCVDRPDRVIVWLAATAWLRHHQTDYDRQLPLTPPAEHPQLRRLANRQASQILKKWQ